MSPEAQIPKKVLDRIAEDHGRDPRYYNDELAALLNPSIHAEPLHTPLSGQIKKRLNSEVEFFWAFDRCGQNPNHERVEQLRGAGFEYATSDDVAMFSEAAYCGRNKDNFTNEIRSGDRRLMKVAKTRWLSIRKSQNLQAINMANPRGKVSEDGRNLMSIASTMPGVQTSTVGDEGIDAIRAKAVLSDASEEIRTGQFKGNASQVSMRKGA